MGAIDGQCREPHAVCTGIEFYDRFSCFNVPHCHCAILASRYDQFERAVIAKYLYWMPMRGILSSEIHTRTAPSLPPVKSRLVE
ncbi:unnamed protein product [Tetraodon nigroviridis]|uniref:Chromosome undetermined SCAF11517, whole genome shotgun sequence n=1 Tax=Tetraodon nigroviridis TaxID=99883 RepID=Q4SZS8_TETNG|nr:unnamed protein product [Tetraodon nigroviridis]